MRQQLGTAANIDRSGRRKIPGHIACGSLSKSEIVVPVIRNKEVVAVLDVDSDAYDQFDETDQQFLEEIVSLINF